MAGTLFGFPFDEELFSYLWKNEPDPVTTALIDSGVLQENAEIASLISNGSDVYTVPFYKTIGGEPANYDGTNDMVVAETEGASQSGIVWGRMQGWKARDFVIDYNSGADPMSQVASQVARFWHKYHQRQLVHALTGVFGVTGNGTPGSDPSDPEGYKQEWADKHTYNIAATSSGMMGSTTTLNETSINDAAVKACGDLASEAFALAIMHSTVAKNLANIGLLEYRKYTDPMGIERTLDIADVNGKVAIVFDGVPTRTSPYDGAQMEYTTYVLGRGSVQTATAPVRVPAEVHRDPMTHGGEEMLLTRERRTMLPNGFSYGKQLGDGPSPSDEMLAEPTRWTPIFDPKCIAMSRIVSNG